MRIKLIDRDKEKDYETTCIQIRSDLKKLAKKKQINMRSVLEEALLRIIPEQEIALEQKVILEKKLSETNRKLIEADTFGAMVKKDDD